MLNVKTYIDKSSIAGLGCFAKEFIPKDTIIWTLRNNFDVVLSDEEFDKLPKLNKEWVIYYSYYNKEEGGYILCMDEAKYFNHSVECNTTDVYQYTIANRDILVGEEIVSNYFTFDKLAEIKLGL